MLGQMVIKIRYEISDCNLVKDNTVPRRILRLMPSLYMSNKCIFLKMIPMQIKRTFSVKRVLRLS